MSDISKCAALLTLSASVLTAAYAQTATPGNTATPIVPAASPAETRAAVIAKAWPLLRAGTEEKGTEHRAAAVRALSLLQGQRRAIIIATEALADPKTEVRTAAATALGDLRATSAIPNLKEALSDKELTVVLAAAKSLLTLKDTSAYETYYSILTGDRKGGGLISDQLEILKDPKKMELLGIHEGIGYIPFGDIGYTAFKEMTKDSTAPVRAVAAKALADDPDPMTQNMLAQEALTDKSELVRIAALEAVAKRGDPDAIDKIAYAVGDPKAAVRFAAAAAILHLNDLSTHKTKAKK